MISVIVPIYNVYQYLNKCIESICSQTYENLEIILVDDGSTDGCSVLCDEFARNDERIHVVHKENGGLVSARKAGLAIATGEYVSYVDADDWIEPDMYEKLMGLGVDADIITFAGREEYENGCIGGLRRDNIGCGLYSSDDERTWLYEHMVVNDTFYDIGVQPYLWAKLIKRDILMDCQMDVPDLVSYAEDVVCTYPCLLKAKSIYITSEQLYHYRIRANSMVRENVSVEKIKIMVLTLARAFSTPKDRLRDSLKVQIKYVMWHVLLLKAYSSINHSLSLFPFVNVVDGSKVAVYGAGLFGKVIYSYIIDSERLIAGDWFDRNYKFYTDNGMNVKQPCEVILSDFDIMVIAILNVGLANKIKSDFICKGINEDRIDIIDLETMEKLELPEYMVEVLEMFEG